MLTHEILYSWELKRIGEKGILSPQSPETRMKKDFCENTLIRVAFFMEQKIRWHFVAMQALIILLVQEAKYHTPPGMTQIEQRIKKDMYTRHANCRLRIGVNEFLCASSAIMRQKKVVKISNDVSRTYIFRTPVSHTGKYKYLFISTFPFLCSK